MTRRKVLLQPRKAPAQARSRQMRNDILQAAVRVLRREGALRFTTPRVAEAAGISVGSLYQYFPNKHAIIFAIHSDTVAQAWVEVQRILDHPGKSAREKVSEIAHFYFVAEARDVAELGAALRDAEIYFADQPEYHQLEAQVLSRFVRFVREACPTQPPSHAEFGAELLVSVLAGVGRSVAARRLPRPQVVRWARQCAGMLADHLGL